jgi:hypothetical protein
MTIFDSIKYPVSDNMMSLNEIPGLPDEIKDYWVKSSHRGGHAALRKLIAEYNTDECEITNPRPNTSILYHKDIYL